METIILFAPLLGALLCGFGWRIMGEYAAQWVATFLLFIAAVLSGGIFGDHASPISDTTIVSSLASASDHIEHVRTQLPYALVAAAIAALGPGTGRTL